MIWRYLIEGSVDRSHRLLVASALKTRRTGPPRTLRLALRHPPAGKLSVLVLLFMNSESGELALDSRSVF